MKNRLLMTVVLVAVFVTLGMQQAQGQVRLITATETTGLPHDFTTLTDSVVGQLCTANEDLTACFATPYNVPSALVNPAFVVNGGSREKRP